MTEPFRRVHHAALNADVDIPASAVTLYQARGWELVPIDETAPVSEPPKAEE